VSKVQGLGTPVLSEASAGRPGSFLMRGTEIVNLYSTKRTIRDQGGHLLQPEKGEVPGHFRSTGGSATL